MGMHIYSMCLVQSLRGPTVDAKFNGLPAQNHNIFAWFQFYPFVIFSKICQGIPNLSHAALFNSLGCGDSPGDYVRHLLYHPIAIAL